MDTAFARLYQDELDVLRELGSEFAREHPKIAARLALGNTEVADPYVERLLEGFAFLSARVRLKLDAEQPRLVAQLLESLYPNFLAPLPAMMVLQFGVDSTDPNLMHGHPVPRASAVQSLLPRGQDTCCEFRTAMGVTLWPIELTRVQYFSHAPDLPLNQLGAARAAQGGLRIGLRTAPGLHFSQLGLNRLALYISAPEDVAYRLHELVLGAGLGSWVQSGVQGGVHGGVLGGVADLNRWRGEDSIRALGFDAEHALLPETPRNFSGHRLLQEVAALPQRLLFFEITDLKDRLATLHSGELELVLLFSRGEPALQALVNAQSLALFCTPAINLFRKRLDRVALSPNAWEHHLVPERTRPMDFEVHSLESVAGHGPGSDGPVAFTPLYQSTHGQAEGAGAHYSLRREPRRAGQRQQADARAPGYLGEEVFISLGEPGHGAHRAALRQLAVSAWVSNRDLPLLLPQGLAGGERAWQLETPGPVRKVLCLRGPTKPASRQALGDVGWQLVAQLSQNLLALDDEAADPAAALRQLLRLYGPANDPAWAHQAEGVRALRVQRVARRLPTAGPVSIGWGLGLEIELDEQRFHGASPFALGGVLERFFARHAAINSFTQTTLRTQQRGVIKTWPVRLGHRGVL